LGTETLKKKLQLSYKQVDIVPGGCPDVITQHQMIFRIQSLTVLAQAGLFHLVFADPTHKVHNTVVGKCWQKKGRDGTIKIASNSGRKRVTILGFLNVVSLNFTSFITESNCDTFANEIAHKELRAEYPDGKEIIVIQDNAKYNHAFAKSKAAKELNTTGLFLPPYSPNLNLIERLWKFMKKKIMKNIYYEKFTDFWDAIVYFCKNLKKHHKELKTLIGQKFQILKAA